MDKKRFQIKLLLGVIEFLERHPLPVRLFLKPVANAPFLGQLPIDPELARLCDEGNIEHYNADVITDIGQSVDQAVSAKVT